MQDNRVTDVDLMIKVETGEATEKELLTLFSSLISSGKAWELQGDYGRTARRLIDENYIDKDGTILVDCDDDE